MGSVKTYGPYEKHHQPKSQGGRCYIRRVTITIEHIGPCNEHGPAAEKKRRKRRSEP